MSFFANKKFNRRTLLGGAAAFGAMHATQAYGSAFEQLRKNRLRQETDSGANSAAALDAIDSIEPIISLDTAYNLELAIQKFEQIVANGGFYEIDRSLFGLRAGMERTPVKKLKRYLISSGDLAADTRINNRFGSDTDEALRRFQARHGIVISGVVEEETLYNMTVPADIRLMQLRLNIQRVSAIAPTLSPSYALVNIPAAVIEAVQGAQVAQRHTAIVGRIDRPTPILSSRIHEINFNPYWHVPKSIIRRDLIKYMNDDPEYLTNYQIRIFDNSGNELAPTDIDWSTEEAVNYAFRQDPGAENSMGHVKINFHNPHAVYLHDTPSKTLFGENRRFHSSGCVRVEDVAKFVNWVLVSNGGWSQEAVEAVFASGERLDVSVAQPVPIKTAYITAWANRDGVVSFRDDVYDYDINGIVQFTS